jgi:NADPH2:quinone reductase
MGRYHDRLDAPFVPGTEAAGEVLESGANVAGLHPRDRVVVHGVFATTPGCFAEEVTLNADYVARLPDGFSFEEGAVFPAPFATSHYALTIRTPLVVNETLLVYGAAGAVGFAATQIGVALGARVIALASSEEKRRALTDCGAHHVLDYRSENLRETVLELTNGRGVDVVFDPVGGNSLEASMRFLAFGGRVLLVGFAAGAIPNVAGNRVLYKEASILGVAYARFGAKQSARANLEAVLRLAEDKNLRIPVSCSLPFADAAKALHLLETRTSIGRPVLIPDLKA